MKASLSRALPAEALVRRVVALAISFALIVVGCRSGPLDNEENPTQPSETIMAVSGATVTVGPMHSELSLLGETVAGRHISLRAPAGGRVISLNILTGDRVKRGEVVGHILSREVEAAANGLEVARQIDPAEAAGLTDAVNRYAGAAGVAVKVPEDAIVAERMVSSGQLVADLDPLADLIDPGSIFVDAAVPVDELAVIRPGMEATVNSPLYPRVDFPAHVAGISPSFNQAGATSPARIEFTGHRRIHQAGAPVEARVTIKSVRDATVIPATALFEDAANDSYYIFLAGHDGRAHRQIVTTGIRNQSEVQVTFGVKPGQVVITSGGYALSDGLKVRVTLAQSRGLKPAATAASPAE
jgi:multidrug efflux pump subunit AcrA (membrane-fusion protein)